MNRTIGIAVALLIGFSLSAFPFGIGAGIGGYTIDLTASLAKMPAAIAAAGTALGLSQAQINDVVGQATAALPDLTVVPVPVIAGTVEFGVPLVVIDSISITGGILTDGIVREIASSMGEPIPKPVIQETFTTNAGSGTVTIDPSFSTYTLTIAVGTRLDLFLAAVDVSLGATWIAGELDPGIELHVPSQFAGQVTPAIAALHPGGISWSGGGITAGLGVELGLPFLRLRTEGAVFIPVYTTSGWWGVGFGGITAGIGITMRF